MFKVKGQKQTLKERFWTFSNEVRLWWNYNKEWAVVVIPVVGMGATWILKKVISGSITSHNLNKEKALKELYIYDRSMGSYWKLRRSLSTNDMLEIEGRRKNGEPMGEILKSMNVLNKRA